MKHTLFLLFTILTLTAYGQHNPVPVTDGIAITGAVKNELHITIKDLLRYRQDTLGSVMISNKKGEDKGLARNMKGVLLKTLLDSAHVYAEKHKDYSELYIVLTGSDGYRNVYSWNEVFNTEVGNHVYVITEMDGQPIAQMQSRILVMSLADMNSGRRHLKGLAKVEVKRVQ